MRKPLIGITCGSSGSDRNTKVPQDRLNCAYSRAVMAAGGLPVILPNLAEPRVELEILDRLDGLLLSGGADIAPRHYGQQPFNSSVEIDETRDVTEIPLAREAVRRDLPVLGICRGIQTLNVALGGTLVQDLAIQKPTEVRHRQTEPRGTTTHPIEIDTCTRMEAALGANRVRVNSLHHQALDRIAEELKATAFAPDGIVEGVEIREARFIVAVQFHPEELISESPEARRLFASFVEAAIPRPPA